MISIAITSCNRVDLLEKTVKSFFKVNTHPIDRVIIRDDSGMIGVVEKIETLNLYKCEVIPENQKIGQLKSIERIYEQIDSEYILHCEDDWEFYKDGFIKKGIEILKVNDRIIQVWIRPKSDGVGHSPENNLVAVKGDQTGYTWNPHIKRKKDCIKYSQVGREREIGQYYLDLGYRSAWLTEGYVKHIGKGRHCVVKPKYKG